jgi:HD-GYP domain-containing protein (c-di-GMP phosphodiesterase class II)
MGRDTPGDARGEEIPVEARVVRVADVFSSLIEERPYKPAMEVKRAMETVKELAGTKLDVEGVRVLQELVDEGAPVL